MYSKYLRPEISSPRQIADHAKPVTNPVLSP